MSCLCGISFEMLLPHLAAVVVEEAEISGDRLEVRPLTCSAKVRAGQSGLPQKNRRARSRIRTRRPPIAASASRRW